MATRFFERLGEALLLRGHAVHRVNFNGGDRAFWRLSGAVDYGGKQHDWPDFLDRLLIEKQVSDIVLFGDCRPFHRAAIRVAGARSVRVHVVEEGYLRPDWITFEEGGTNGFSSLPRDPGWYIETARSLPPWQEGPLVPGSFRRRAVEDVIYTLSSMAGVWRFPHYRTHRPYHPLVEYAGWIRRLTLRRRAERRAVTSIEGLIAGDNPFFFFPLQLDDDYQVRVHSPFRALHLAIERVVGSFARHAPAGTLLAVKLHPLDSGLMDWAGITGHIAADFGVANRLVIVDGGDLGVLVQRSRGVVTINSTVGALSLMIGQPTAALGRAIYDMPGLTFQGDLDAFWGAPTPPDPQVFDAFRRVLAARCLIPGSFFNENGLNIAVDAAVARLEAAYSRPVRGSAEPASSRSSPERTAIAAGGAR